MKITAGAWLLAVGTLCGCGVEASCPDGQRKVNGACVEETQESSLESDASVDDERMEADASVDAGESMSSEGGVDADDVEQNMSGEVCFPDQDGDGHGAKGQPVPCDTTDVALVTIDDDCNDDDRTVFGAAAELCDGVDNDCDGEVDENIEVLTFYEDLDDDGYGTMETTVEGCKPPEGYALALGDCDEQCPTCFPGALELCDDLDNDCDGRVDEGVRNSCGQCLSEVAAEICDGVDNNCNGQVDEGVRNECGGCARLDAKRGAPCSVGIGACMAGGTWSCDGEDAIKCSAVALPGTDEDCNTPIDDDCDGIVNDVDSRTKNVTTWFCDADSDGFGNFSIATRSCSKPKPTGSCPDWTKRRDEDDCNDKSDVYRPNTPHWTIPPENQRRGELRGDLNCDNEVTTNSQVGLLKADLTIWKFVPRCNPEEGITCECAKYLDKGGDCYVLGSNSWEPVALCVLNDNGKPRWRESEKGFFPCR